MVTSVNRRRFRKKKRKTPAKRLATIKRAIDAWNEISEETIKKSFEKAIPGRAKYTKAILRETLV
jgi:hypothetical protein